ncbi:MAG TPA: magnesium transporter, partial [Thermoanaerobaculia bacterium]|nr:magnesium transporter [Thermoanaerobaculia bacterium]
ELDEDEDAVAFRLLPRDLATDVFEYLPHDKQVAVVEAMADERGRLAELLNDLAPDERTAFLEELPGSVAQRLLTLLSPRERRIAVMLLGYPEDSVGRLMTTDYVAVRPEWTARQALEHVRRFGKDSETLNVIYVVDGAWRLVDDLRLREVLLADPETSIEELMDRRFAVLTATDDQETAVGAFRDYDRVALPVTDSHGTLLGIVTHDDVLDVAEEEATEDIHKIGGSEALEEPYLDTPFPTLVQKRAKWLVVLFFGEMLTATAMGAYADEIHRAVVLALFVPLIISSGGNSGSQAATLVIRALAVGELVLADWWRVARRELLSGLSLGGILGAIAVVRVVVVELAARASGEAGVYGEAMLPVAVTLGITLVGVVLLGTLAGSMLPFLMQRLGADPATSSAPFVATLVDVAGLLIYFSVAVVVLRGTLL